MAFLSSSSTTMEDPFLAFNFRQKASFFGAPPPATDTISGAQPSTTTVHGQIFPMSSIIQTFQNRAASSLPVSQISDSKDEQQGLRRRLSSFSLKIQPITSHATSWAFRRSKSVSSMGEYAGSSIRNWWDWGWSWILSRKPIFTTNMEMNEEETKVLSSHNRGSWRHLFYKVRSELRKIVRSDSKVGLPQTCRYDSFNYSKNFDNGVKY